MTTIDEGILLQYIDGLLSEEERMQVESWASLTPENEKSLYRLYYTSEVIDRLHIHKRIDTDSALRSVKSTIFNKQKGRVSKREAVKVWQLVAIALLMLVVSLSLWGLLKEKEEQVYAIEVHTNPGIVSAVDLPDGSKVWLNAESSFTYPSAFTAENRTVELKGEGFFEVSEYKKRPFLIKIEPSYIVEVLGTTVNISAYDNDDVIETTLVEGAVMLHLGQSGANRKSSQLLNPNEKATINRSTGNLTIDILDVSSEIAWIHGELIFRNEPLARVIKILGRHFNVDFVVCDEELFASMITARFTDEQLPQVMEFLKQTSLMDYEIKEHFDATNEQNIRTVVEVRKKK